LAAVKDFSLQRKRLLTEEEFRGIANANLPARAASAS